MSKSKCVRFGMVMEPVVSRSLDFLVEHERISAAAVVRRLIWREAQQMGCEFPDVSEESRSNLPEAMSDAHG